jgi:hypothetical protein
MRMIAGVLLIVAGSIWGGAAVISGATIHAPDVQNWTEDPGGLAWLASASFSLSGLAIMLVAMSLDRQKPRP